MANQTPRQFWVDRRDEARSKMQAARGKATVRKWNRARQVAEMTIRQIDRQASGAESMVVSSEGFAA